VRLRVGSNVSGASCWRHVFSFTPKQAHLYTDEWDGYNGVGPRGTPLDEWLPTMRAHSRVHHRRKEWARDDDGDGVREVHTNSMEGLWTTVRNFLRPFRGVHKCYLEGYIAICEWRCNLKEVTPAFICALVAQHLSLSLSASLSAHPVHT
jgi:transposase-like protein